MQHILARHGLGHLSFIANPLQQCGQTRWALAPDCIVDTCRAITRICNCQIVEDATAEVVYIGDRATNTYVAQRADVILAKEELADYCVAQRLPHLHIQSFADALLIVHQLRTPPPRYPAIAH